ncbi:MAG: inverse autotransporter beta domain-containing protein, partial [Veillonella atypica]
MKRILVVKAMVLGTIACSISAIGFGAGVESTHIPDATNMQQSTQGTEKHEAVQSNWMDRTDIKVGTQSKVGAQVSVETLQPLTHYDENSKSVLFVQGGIGRGGQEHSASYYHGYNEIWYPYNPATGKGDQRYMAEKYEHMKSLGIVANVGLGYRHLSKNEHAYVGVNAFVDRAFSENANRVSGGLEYVSGLNEVRANVYRGLGSVKSQSDMIYLPQSYFTFDLDGGAAYYMP